MSKLLLDNKFSNSLTEPISFFIKTLSSSEYFMSLLKNNVFILLLSPFVIICVSSVF